MAEYIEREAVCYQLAKQATIDGQPRAIKRAEKIVADFPAADVPPALWTDEPISGSEFMTHKQGQSGFEIHFRTDDKAKYEAVQDECRRQIGHAKPAADVRPVVLCKDCKWYEINELKKDGTEDRRYKPSVCMLAEQRREPNHFCADGEKREES